jgi:hypothetical protein
VTIRRATPGPNAQTTWSGGQLAELLDFAEVTELSDPNACLFRLDGLAELFADLTRDAEGGSTIELHSKTVWLLELITRDLAARVRFQQDWDTPAGRRSYLVEIQSTAPAGGKG